MIDTASGTVVVSGASSGVGHAVARALAERGRTVVALARRRHRLEELAASAGPGRIVPCVADVRCRETVAQALAELPETETVDTVVNNAGLSKGFGRIQDADPEDWRTMVETNVGGMLTLTSVLLPRLVARGGGQVVNVGSIAAHYPYTGGNVYGATKAFVHQLSLSMRTDLEGTGVRVSCVAPGMTRTEFALVRFDGDAERAARLYDGITPLSADDVARTVLWCIDQPPHVNVNMIEFMPTEQPFGLGFAGSRS